LIASCVLTDRRVLVTVIFTLWPEASDPVDGETVSPPMTLEATVTVYWDMGPFWAVSVSVPVPPPTVAVSTSVLGVTLSVP
jgi:hypothetical protein